MASAHHPPQHPRYSLPPPPNAHNDFRLPSLKDLNFQYRPPPSQEPSPTHTTAAVDSPAGPPDHPRHPQPWVRSNAPSAGPPSMSPHPQHPHQQHTPPLSAGHESSPPKSDYSSKHDNGGYLTPGMPLSAQMTPVPGSVNIGPGTRGDDAPHSQNQHKRPRIPSTHMSAPRDMRPTHAAYAPQYASYPPSQPPPTSPYHQISTGMPGPPSHPPPPPHEQMHQHPVPVPNHPTYGYQQPQYMQPRPHVHSQHPSHQPQPIHGNPYPSPGPPSSAPPPQGPWEQQQPPPHHQPQYHHHQHPPPPQHLQQHSQHTQHVVHPQHQPSHQPPPPPPHPQMHMQQQQQPPPPPQQHHQQQQQQQQQQISSPPHHQQQPLQPHQPQPQQQHAHHHHQPPPPQHHQQPVMPFASRTTPLVPTNIDARGPYTQNEPERPPSARDQTMSEIVKHCSALYAFASRYAQLQASLPHVQPSSAEISEMAQRASQVVRLLDEYRRMTLPEAERSKMDSGSGNMVTDDYARPPKRPWEDMASQDGPEAVPFTETYAATTEKTQTTAEQDMEIIRTKRATSAAGGNGTAGQPKSKYRKRSRATPPGKCHSCNIRETPEWRRGPDGARTLCNACGLHYAKLMRKRDKAHGTSGDAPRIDMETLRASARAADLADKSHSRGNKQQSSHSDEPGSPLETVKQQPQQHHQGSFQLSMMNPDPVVSVAAPPEPSRVSVQQTHHNNHNHNHNHNHGHGMSPSTGSIPIPPPPWATAAPSSGVPAARGYVSDQLQQSFMRTSQQAHTSPSR